MTQWGKGQVINDRYQLLEQLGHGGMSSVWRAEHLEQNVEVAVKLLDPNLAQNADMLARFLREARASASLKSRHVVQVIDHGIEDGNAFMVMELLHGETLGARIRRQGPLGAEQTGTFMCQVMRAIDGAHQQGIVHRDLKPDNIFITSDAAGEYAKVLDFGVAKVAGAELDQADGLKTQAGVMLGTPYYMSPEQAKALPVDHRADIWALTVITFECLLGKRPFTGDSFADLVVKLCTDPLPIPSASGQVPLGFDEWFCRGTRRDALRRFTSAWEMAEELMQISRSAALGPPRRAAVEVAPAASQGRGGVRQELGAPRPKKSGTIGLAVLGILAAAGAGAALAFFLRQGDGARSAVDLAPAAVETGEVLAGPASPAEVTSKPRGPQF